MTEHRRYYPYLFWDNPEIENLAHTLSLQDFRSYLATVKQENPYLFTLLLRRFIERGSLTESFNLLELEDIEKGLRTLRLWDKIPQIRMYAWNHALEFMKGHSRGGECLNS
jgi:hypothetical protein